ncbi:MULTISPECIES: methanol oxidation system protein MoxJ [unclassified Haematobacter]|uniref:methanol oxidation system protein MoxJ n=1 Tax=unclassified Haematobacter TaxID=2640585 RepID=UPI0025BA6371|nr:MULTISPECIES: methanol oxidation system protein MoxJ [unclassified Haematobacter]
MKTRSVIAGLAITLATSGMGAAETAKEPLRVCASTKDAPFSQQDGSGFENRLAQVMADAIDRPLELVWVNKEAIYLVRDGVDTGQCDVMMGVDTGDPRLLTTQPYYRSGYVFVTRQDTPLESDHWEALGDQKLDTIAYRLHGPAEVLVKYAGKYENNLIYVTSLTNFEDKRNKYTNVEAARVVSEVAKGDADVGVAFGPEIARYVKSSRTPLKVTVISNHLTRSNGVEVPLQFNQSMGVVKSKPELRDALDKAIVEKRAEIEAILTEEGIPLLPPSS